MTTAEVERRFGRDRFKAQICSVVAEALGRSARRAQAETKANPRAGVSESSPSASSRATTDRTLVLVVPKLYRPDDASACGTLADLNGDTARSANAVSAVFRSLTTGR